MARPANRSIRLIGPTVAAQFLFATVSLAEDCRVFDSLESYTTTSNSPTSATCATYLTDNGSTAVSCYWSYPYRDTAVQTRSAELWHQLKTCRSGHAMTDDTQVNHPDSYYLRTWAYGRHVYTVSIKDKAALNRTLVFIRFEPDQDLASD